MSSNVRYPTLHPGHADRVAQRNVHNKLGRMHKAAMFEKFKTLVCWYQLYRGDTPMGKPREMVVADSMAANKRYRDSFYADKSPTARMWEWRAIARTNREKAKAEFRQLVKSLPLPPEKSP